MKFLQPSCFPHHLLSLHLLHLKLSTICLLQSTLSMSEFSLLLFLSSPSPSPTSGQTHLLLPFQRQSIPRQDCAILLRSSMYRGLAFLQNASDSRSIAHFHRSPSFEQMAVYPRSVRRTQDFTSYPQSLDEESRMESGSTNLEHAKGTGRHRFDYWRFNWNRKRDRRTSG